MIEKGYSVYIKTNNFGYITAVNSSAFLTDTMNWLEIDNGYGDKYHHAQGNYFTEPIRTISGAYRYKLVDGKPVECTAEEIAEQENTLAVKEPSEIEDLSALIVDQEYRITLLELGLIE